MLAPSAMMVVIVQDEKINLGRKLTADGLLRGNLWAKSIKVPQ